MGKRNNHAFWLGFGVTLSLLVAGTVAGVCIGAAGALITARVKL